MKVASRDRKLHVLSGHILVKKHRHAMRARVIFGVGWITRNIVSDV